MADLAALLERTTPADLPALDRCDLADLARDAGHRTRRRRAVAGAAGLSLLVAVAGAVAAATGGPGGPGRAEGPWAGPGGEALEAPVGSWTQAEDPPFSARHGVFGAALSDGRVLVWGGQSGNEIALDGGIYDPSTGRWDAIPPGPFDAEVDYGIFRPQLQVARDRLAVVTSDLRRVIGEVTAAVYDVERSRWLSIPTLDLGDDRTGVAEMAWDGETLALLLVAFRPGTGGEPATWRWSVGDGAWQPGAPAPTGPRIGGGTAFDGRRLVLWGGTTEGRPQSDGAVYDVTTDSWDVLPAAPVAGAEHPLVLWQGGRVLVSPATLSGPVLDQPLGRPADLAAYDPLSGTWERIGPPPGFRSLDGHLYLASDGEAYMPRDLWSIDSGSVPTHYLVRAVLHARARDAQEPWFLESEEWERAPFARLFRLGGYTVAVSGRELLEPCCLASPRLSVRVRVGPGEWIEATEAPFPPRRYETIVATGDKLVLIGGAVQGEDRNTRSTGDTWVFDLAG